MTLHGAVKFSYVAPQIIQLLYRSSDFDRMDVEAREEHIGVCVQFAQESRRRFAVRPTNRDART